MRVVIIGSGIGGLGAACLLAKAGHQVTLLEKNKDFGGRNGQFKQSGFTFPYGPTWYLMPEVFERFYGLLDEKIDKHLKLKRQAPHLRAYFKDVLVPPVEITGNIKSDARSLADFEPYAHEKLVTYLDSCKQSYDLSMEKFIYRNYGSPFELLKTGSFKAAKKVGLNQTMYNHVGNYFLNEQIKQIFSYPAVFVGTSPFRAPSAYRMINHSIYKHGVYSLKGGMYSLSESLVQLAKEYGATLKKNSEVRKISVKSKKVSSVQIKNGKQLKADIVISNTGLPQTDLLIGRHKTRGKHKKFWLKKQFSPSALLIYLGIKGKINLGAYHNFIFTERWLDQFTNLESGQNLPADPSIYVCHISKDDPQLAPKGHSSLFAIVPIAKNIAYTTKELAEFSEKIIDELVKNLSLPNLKKRLVYKKIFASHDFIERYNAFDGSMLGLNHTFRQTGPFRQQNKSKDVGGLYFVGSDTVPGIGVPMCLISAELVSTRVEADLNS